MTKNEFYKSTWVLEYSPEQRAFHISHITDMVRNNVELIVRNKKFPGYVPIGFYDTPEQAEFFANKMTGALDK